MSVGSVVKAIRILRHLAGSWPQGVNAVARAVELSPSTTFNILKTLADEGFVDFDPREKTYRLGREPARLFRESPDMQDWRTWLRQELVGFAGTHSVACGIWQVISRRLVLIEVAESPLATRIHLTVGQRLPAHIGAMGRCIAVSEKLNRGALRAALKPLRWQAPPSLDDYWDDMQRAAARGWAIDRGNYLKGVTSLAAAVCDPAGEVRYCITSTGFSGQHEPAAIEAMGRAMAQLAEESSRRLFGGLPGSPPLPPPSASASALPAHNKDMRHNG